MRANFVMSGVWTGVRRNLTMTIALILSTGIALAFVGAAYLASTEISNFKRDYEGRLNVSVFLCAKSTQSPCHGKTTTAQTTELSSALRADPRIQSVKYVSEKAQYDRAVKIEPTAFAKVAKVGDLGASFTVVLKNLPRDFDGFAREYGARAGVYSVANQVDTLKTLLKIIDGARLFSIMVAVVVLIASILLIANTIQVAAQQRRNETSIMRLVGASRWMTELPFMLETIFATIIGGLISVGLLAVGKAFVLNGIFKAPVERKVIPNLDANDLLVAGGIGMIAGIVLAAITAFATLRLYVKV